jgi:hypothetical protein
VSRFLVSLTPEFNAQALLLDGWTGGVHQALTEHYEWLATNPFARSRRPSGVRYRVTRGIGGTASL